jgi:hypothetical protein
VNRRPSGSCTASSRAATSKLAAILHKSEAYLWPNAMSSDRATKVSESEIVRTYPHRSAIPPNLWDQLLDQAQDTIDILVYVGMFMTEKPKVG